MQTKTTFTKSTDPGLSIASSVFGLAQLTEAQMNQIIEPIRDALREVYPDWDERTLEREVFTRSRRSIGRFQRIALTAFFNEVADAENLAQTLRKDGLA